MTIQTFTVRARRSLRALSRAKFVALAFLAATFPPMLANAQQITPMKMNVFTSALLAGEATSPIPEGGVTEKAIQSLKASSHNDGALAIHARRVVRFEQQPTCGRVSFEVMQPSSGKRWPQLGGQFNICANGTPPLQICKDAPGKLVPSTSRCADLTRPQNTPEVDRAIQQAVASGQETGDQVRQRLAKQRGIKQ